MHRIGLKTPISYYGEKQQLSSVILSLLPPHKAYNEPFFGGGAIFFAKRPCEREYINDLNGAMINFYRVLKHNFDELSRIKGKFLLSSFPNDILSEYAARFGWRQLEIEMHRSAGYIQGARKVEVLTYNYDAECDRQSSLFDY